MAEQLPLFETREPSWAERLRERLVPPIRERLRAILVEMAQAQLRSPPLRPQEEDRDER